jgi:putative oxidoreductase
MSHSLSIAAAPTPLVHRNRLQSIALWSLQVVLVGMFLLAGGSKLAGAATMVALFDAIGIGQWFRYLTGGIEVVSAVALLVPSLAPFGAIALVATMVGAVATRLLIVGGSPAVPAVLLLGSLVGAWARRGELSAAVSKVL